MKKYLTPYIRISNVDEEDILTTSDATNADLKSYLQSDIFDEYK